MKSLLRIVMISLVGCATFTSHVRAADAKPAKGVAGIWHGALIYDDVHLRLILKIKEDPEGHYTGVFDSPDRRKIGLPLSDITLKDNQLRFECKPRNIVFEGTYDPEKNEIKGTWKQQGTMPVTFSRTPVIRRPQEPLKPFPYLEEEVAYENKKGKAHLAGTLTLPRTGGPFPAVLLITGSGQQDRDETILSHKPFLVIADYLTRKGIAVLRVDDRETGDSTGEVDTATTADFAEDALASVEFLKSRTEIDPRRIGLIGHSEGATIATMLAARSRDVAFIVMLAGIGVSGDEMLILQIQAKNRIMGASKSQLESLRAVYEKVIAILKQENAPAAAQKKIQQLLDDENAKLPKLLQVLNGEKLKAQAEAEAKTLAATVTSPWWRYVLSVDPKPILMRVQCPVLALNGDKDFQVPAKEHLSGIEQALKAGGNKDYTIKELPNLNHLFQTCKTGAGSEYAKIEETFAPSALEFVGDWIVKHTRAK